MQCAILFECAYIRELGERANQSFKCMRSLIGDHNFAIVDYPDLMLARILTKAPVSLTPAGPFGINKKPVPANDLFNQAN
jgi:hypothetical protein